MITPRRRSANDTRSPRAPRYSVELSGTEGFENTKVKQVAVV
jgi:hypothetical protein